MCVYVLSQRLALFEFDIRTSIAGRYESLTFKCVEMNFDGFRFTFTGPRSRKPALPETKSSVEKETIGAALFLRGYLTESSFVCVYLCSNIPKHIYYYWLD